MQKLRLHFVMPVLDTGIHGPRHRRRLSCMDNRVKPGYDKNMYCPAWGWGQIALGVGSECGDNGSKLQLGADEKDARKHTKPHIFCHCGGSAEWGDDQNRQVSGAFHLLLSIVASVPAKK